MASGSYARVRHAFWTDPDIKRTLTAEQKTLLLYYFSSPHANMIGVYNCPFAYVVDETGLSLKTVEQWTTGPLARFVTYDCRTEEVFVHRSARHNICEDLKAGDKRLPAVCNQLAQVHSQALVNRFLELYHHWPLNVRTPTETEQQGPLSGPFSAPSMPLRSHSIAVAMQSNAEAEQSSVSSLCSETGAGRRESYPQSKVMEVLRGFGHTPGVEREGSAQLSRLMGVLRECRFVCDRSDASILVTLLSKKVEPEAIENVVRGLTLMRDRGNLRESHGIEPNGELSMKLVYAKAKGTQMPLWSRATVAFDQDRKNFTPAPLNGIVRLDVGRAFHSSKGQTNGSATEAGEAR